jgi:hypothetical protein
MKIPTFLFLSIGIACHAGFGVAAEPVLTLAEDGEARAVIVIAADASAAAKQGATILGEHLTQASGAEFDIVTEKELNETDDILLLVGQGVLASSRNATAEGLEPGGILIKTFPNAIVMLGADDPLSTDPNGTRYAVTTFLEDALGVRFLWPGEMGKVVPEKKTIRIESIDHRFNPILAQRKIRMGGGWSRRMSSGGERLLVTEKDFQRLNPVAKKTESEDGGWAGWHRMGGSLRLASGHSFGDYWERFGESHPEWFAMAPNGSRDQGASPHRARLCVSNPELVEQVARDRIALIERTGQKSVAIGPNDGGTTSFCTCEKCEALDAPSDRKITLIDFSPGANRRQFEHVPLTDRYVHFWNEIAERVTAAHPDVWLTADAYSTYSAPPVKAKLHPNIAIRYVGVTYLDDERRAQGIADWDAWGKSASKIYFRSNLLLAGRRQGTTVLYPHRLAEDFRKLAPNRMIGTDLDSCMNHWATQGLNYYVMARLLWNPDLDVDDLLDDYCGSGFGAGAESVKRYFLEIEKLTDQIAAEKLPVTRPFTPEAVATLRTHLEEAAKATADDPESNRRVSFLRVGLDYTETYSAVFHLIQAWEEAGGGRLEGELKERFRVALDQNWEASRDIFDNHPLAVNVASVAWGSWGYFNRLAWKGPSESVIRRWQRPE